jgi:hypothetical protein
MPKHRAAHIGRNSPCPCGSGRKFKHCCMAKRNRMPWTSRLLLALVLAVLVLGVIAIALLA